MRLILLASLLSRANAQFPSCECDSFVNGLKSDKIGHQACAKYENSKLICKDPTRPYVAHIDSGCDASWRCVVAEAKHATNFKFPVKAGIVSDFGQTQPAFKACTCTQGANGANPTECSAGPKKLCQKPGDNVCYPANMEYETKVGAIDLFTCREDQERCTACTSNAAPVLTTNYDDAGFISCGVLRMWGRKDLPSPTTITGAATGTNRPSMATLLPVDLGVPGAKAIALSSGGDSHNVCVLMDIVYGHSNLKCFNNKKQTNDPDLHMLGQNSLVQAETPAAVPTIFLGVGRKAVRVKCMYQKCCAILDNGAMRCWGYNGGSEGQLGQGRSDTFIGGTAGSMESLNDIDVGTGRTVIDVALNYYNICAVLDNGDLKCWGYESYAGLGNGCCPSALGSAACGTSCSNVGNSPGQMGDNLAPVFLGTGRTAVKVVGGDEGEFCVLLDNSYGKCFGGYGAKLAVHDLFGPNSYLAVRPCHISGKCNTPAVGQSSVGMYVGRYAGDMETLPYLGDPTPWKIKDLQSNRDNACALLESGDVKCWGYNDNGQAGLGISTPVNGQIQTPCTPTPCTTPPSFLLSELQPIDLGTTRKVQAITMSRQGVCARFEPSSATDHLSQYKCWGKNSYGILGNEQDAAYGTTPGTMGTALPYMVTTGLTAGPYTCYDQYTKYVTRRHLGANSTSSP
jgi:hypothetical protein